jgi:drug/metabolite transporter (DMT)-like permease
VSSSKTDAGAVGALLIVVAAVCFGTLGPLSRFAEDAGVGALGLVAWRDLLGAGCVIAFLAFQRRPIFSLRGIPATDRRMLALAAVCNTALNLAIFVAFLRISIALALLLFYLYPAFVALASVLWFGERLDRLRWAALAISLTGVVLVVGGGESLGTVDLLGVGLAAFAGIVQAGYVLIARHGFNAVPGAQAGVITMGGAVGLLVIIGLLTGQAAAFREPLASLAAFWPVLLAGTLGAGVPTVAFILGIRLLGASRGAILATLEPVVGVALAALLLGERPGPLQLIGGALIIVAGVLLQLGPYAEGADHEALASPS